MVTQILYHTCKIISKRKKNHLSTHSTLTIPRRKYFRRDYDGDCAAAAGNGVIQNFAIDLEGALLN